ncbi:hypothetical protein RHGRI_026202 [Rhododendron griersonianum]|uniref:Uncharacterized protein n=1 Tax=Rhododendron griersonianum TaxID=479676 RepID=A0AAV6IVE0_9ERIC|nr:hypothetical protein RHGRI_026202 [Rhododendron griersonianum]
MATHASYRNPIRRFPSSELEEKFELFCERPVALELQLDVGSLGITGDQYKLSTKKRKPFNIHSISISAAHASELSEDDTSVHVNDTVDGENSSTTDMLVDLQVDN